MVVAIVCIFCISLVFILKSNHFVCFVVSSVHVFTLKLSEGFQLCDTEGRLYGQADNCYKWCNLY